jgi:hypothetical protein
MGFFVSWNFSSFIMVWGISAPVSVIEYLHVALFFMSLAFVYITSYPAWEADSPTVLIIMAIGKAGSDGLDKSVFQKLMKDNLLLKPRVKDLVKDNMVYMDGDRYRLTSKGALLARVFVFYRKLINASKGG